MTEASNLNTQDGHYEETHPSNYPSPWAEEDHEGDEQEGTQSGNVDESSMVFVEMDETVVVVEGTPRSSDC